MEEQFKVGTTDAIMVKGVGAMVMGTGSASTPKSEPKQAVKTVQEYQGVAPWGTNNKFPQEVVKDIEKSDIMPMALDKKAAMLYGEGLVYGYMAKKENSNEFEFKRLMVPEIEDWLVETGSDLFNACACSDHFTFYNLFVRFTLTRDRSKIARMQVSDATMTRLGVQNKSGKITKAYVNANWADGKTADSEDTLKFTAIDPFHNQAEQIRDAKEHEFIMPVRTPKRGRVYYELAPYDAIRHIGWLDVAKHVPQFKNFLMLNQMTVKFLVFVDDQFWPMKFGDAAWNKLDEKERTKKKSEFVTSLLESSKGNEKSGGVLILPQDYDQQTGKYREMVRIEELQQTFKGGDYNEDSQEADFHIVRSVGLPPSLIGITPGKGHNSGSGSDQRVARNNFVLDSFMDMQRVLLAYKVVSEYNGWDEHAKEGRLVWMFKNYYTATLDSGNAVQTKIEKANGNS